MLNLLWLGPVVEPSDTHLGAVSPAANKWQRSLIEALLNLGCDVTVISYIPASVFPKGPFYVSPYYGDSKLNIKQIGFFNLPFFRSYSLAAGYKAAVKRVKNADVLITYNNYFHNRRTAKYLSKKGIIWVSIVADDDYVDGPDLTVFLSYAYYKKAPIKSKLHLDGGVDKFKKHTIQIPIKKVLLFNGALNEWTGIVPFARQFSKVDLPNFELHIYGKGTSRELEAIANLNRNIIIYGFASTEQLEKARIAAFAFVNPRPVDIKDGEKNFPSKILEYIESGKPIISTKTEGLHPRYNDLLFYYQPDDLNSLKEILQKIDNMEMDELLHHQVKTKKFTQEHTWQNHAKELLDRLAHL